MSSDRPIISRFESDMTLRWSCRAGDQILWFRWNGIFSSSASVTIRDVWEAKDGDFVTITNRVQDVPGWFRFHPSEVCGANALRLYEQDQAGNLFQPLVAANIWRVMAGDRLAWLSYSGPYGESLARVQSILDMRASAVAIGDNARGLSYEEYALFGGLAEDELPPEKVRLAQQAVRAVRDMGTPNSFAEMWLLG